MASGMSPKKNSNHLTLPNEMEDLKSFK
jgi:hypothetical protein